MHCLSRCGHLSLWHWLSVRCSAIALACLVCGTLLAAGARAADPAEEDDTKPQDITLTTNDGLELKATFYPTTLNKKERSDAVPIIILHAWKGDRGDCESLAKLLQEQGHAVITPDLRGHGESVVKGKLDDAARLRLADFRAMITKDMEAVKEFLVKKNNEGQLNIERLGIIGAEMGAVIALNFAARDWAYPPLNQEKQGQDVKALIIISPEWNFKGLLVVDALQSDPINHDISFLIIAGKQNSTAFREADKLYQHLKRFHLDPDKKDLFLLDPATKLQGMKLVNGGFGLEKKIAKFIELRLVDEKYPWAERKLPGQGK